MIAVPESITHRNDTGLRHTHRLLFLFLLWSLATGIAVFFATLLHNTVEGYFADPVYGGNRDYAGWKMVGFPGAYAYYLTEVSRYNMAYDRPPYGIGYDPRGSDRHPPTKNQTYLQDRD